MQFVYRSCSPCFLHARHLMQVPKRFLRRSGRHPGRDIHPHATRFRYSPRGWNIRGAPIRSNVAREHQRMSWRCRRLGSGFPTFELSRYWQPILRGNPRSSLSCSDGLWWNAARMPIVMAAGKCVIHRVVDNYRWHTTEPGVSNSRISNGRSQSASSRPRTSFVRTAAPRAATSP